ncbi:MAG TPA: phytanoyl-CoA dioxygenase family protein [Mucilaginibacter sp.]|jgi:ectoine hydroxylase-related dioxygenase (phytanoyl-CoA dioxygenase family)|nr:phytanoyl-CoA dioxygenase family protein [Mucilaginibacter sp.]
MITANLPWVESPFFEELLNSKELSEEQIKLAREYHKNGFVVVSGLLPQSLIDKTREDAEKKAFDPNFKIKTQRDTVRVQDFWKVSEPSRALACYPQLLDLLKLLYERNPIPFQTLNFSVGSQQRAHSDTIHFSSLPPRYMCGVWVALEDITEENGPVFYYPGSQRLTEFDFSHIRTSKETTSYENYLEYEDFIEKIVAVNKLEKKKFLAKKGDLLIWSSNIIHGGSPVTKTGLSRWSQVTHYFFEECYYYTPMLSNMVTNELYLRRRLINIETGEKVKQSYNGKKLRELKTSKKLYLLTNKTPNLFTYLKSMI